MKKSLYEYAIKHAMNRRSFVKGAASAGAIAAMSGGLSSVATSAFADSNSDRRTNNLFFAYFLNGQYDKCDEIFKTINEPTNRTWLLRTHSKFKNGDNFQDEVWYKKGLNEFKDLDWDNEVDRFHLNNEELQKKLTATAKAQFA